LTAWLIAQAASGGLWQTVVVATLTGTIGGAIATFVRLPTQRKLDQAQVDTLKSDLDRTLWERMEKQLERCQTENDELREEMTTIRSYIELLRSSMMRNNLTVPPMPVRHGVESPEGIVRRIPRRRENK
jgi:hypothetical protein